MNLNISGIYLITNILNDKNYIGSASNFRNRRKNHTYYLNENKHHNKYLQNSWNKHGRQSFVFIFLEKCDVDKLIEREQYCLDVYKCFAPDDGYNIRIKAESSLGLAHSYETIEKIRIVNINKYVSDETIEKIRAASTGRKHSEETKKKISLMTKGKNVGDKNPSRNKEKWPHELGAKCKCFYCRQKIRDYVNERRRILVELGFMK